MPAFYRSEVDQIPLSGLPEWLQDIIKDPLKAIATDVFDLALGYVYDVQKEYIEASPASIWEETDGIAEGLCDVLKCSALKLAEYKKKIRHINMLPELIRMQCSMMGAWGVATPNGKLVQMRTLDFGSGPFANVTFLAVAHPSDAGHDFASVSFPGMVGGVTGFSKYIGQCEKVDDVTGGKRPRGTYHGQAVSMVIRDVLQFAETKEKAVEMTQAAKRTWSVWLGFGDHASQQFEAVLYDEEQALALNDSTLPALTGESYQRDVAYIDKHPQPSTTDEMANLVKKFYGNMTAEIVAQEFPSAMQSGDVHTAVYDMGNRRAFIARGTTDAAGSFVQYAYQAPIFAFDMDNLWNEIRSS